MIEISKVLMGEPERDAITRVLETGNLAQGAEVAAFEVEFSELVESRTCVAVNSGTSALHIGMLSLGLQPGDEVIVPSFTFAATANAVVLAGGTPVFADIDPTTFCLDPSAVEAAVTSRTVGIIPVHLFGHVADMSSLLRIANAAGLWVFEDACQSHGARDPIAPSGVRGDLAAFSFYATKNMTTGEGGMLVTTTEEQAVRAKMFRNQGMRDVYRNEVIGLNNRMTDVAAAIGRVQLSRLPGFTEARRSNADYLSSHLNLEHLPVEMPGYLHVFHQYTVRVRRRNELQEALTRRGVESRVYYPVPVHHLPSFANSQDLPETTRACTEVLSLPVHPGLGRGELEAVVAAVNESVHL